MRTQGTTFSAVGHLGLIGWLFLGWGFEAEPLEFTTTSVSIISGEEFEEQIAAATPEPGTADPTVPVPPVIDESPPPTPAVEEPTETAPPPEPVEPPVEEVPPPPAPEPLPPEPVVPDAEPVEPTPPTAPPSTPDVEVTDTPTPRDAPVVAPNPSVPTAPDTPIDVIERPDVETEPSADPVDEPPVEDPTTLEDRTDRIVIEDETPSGLVETSLRPKTRPSRPTPPAPEPEEETQTAEADTPAEPASEPEPTVENDGQSVEDVLAGLGLDDVASEPATEAPALPLGQGGLNDTERGSFFGSIGNQWSVDPGAESATISVTVTFSIGRDRRLDGDVQLTSVTAGSAAAQDVAFQNARRAIWTVSRSGGFPLPDSKYESWKNVRLTFDPSQMRIR